MPPIEVLNAQETGLSVTQRSSSTWTSLVQKVALTGEQRDVNQHIHHSLTLSIASSVASDLSETINILTLEQLWDESVVEQIAIRLYQTPLCFPGSELQRGQGDDSVGQCADQTVENLDGSRLVPGL